MPQLQVAKTQTFKAEVTDSLWKTVAEALETRTVTANDSLSCIMSHNSSLLLSDLMGQADIKEAQTYAESK